MPKFPKLIHVTQEQDTPKDVPYYLVHEGGVFDIDEDQKPIAIYKLVEVGEVAVMKSFVRKGLPKDTQTYNSPVKRRRKP